MSGRIAVSGFKVSQAEWDRIFTPEGRAEAAAAEKKAAEEASVRVFGVRKKFPPKGVKYGRFTFRSDADIKAFERKYQCERVCDADCKDRGEFGAGGEFDAQ